MDHYKVLGVEKNATKEDIKRAFRELAMRFHPDKHSQSSKHLRDSATLKFKQLSEAYDTLIDDRKRADYNFRRSNKKHYYSDNNNNNNTSYNYRHYNNNNNNSNSYGYGYSRQRRNGDTAAAAAAFTKFEMGIRFLTTKAFLLNATFIGVLLGGIYIVDAGGKALWNRRNSGKSFEEAMESVEKAKAIKDDSY